MECTYCGEELDEEELENPYKDYMDDVMCDECYRDTQDKCTICEEYYDKPKGPEETFFVLNKEYAEEQKMPTGVYKVLAWPYYSGSIIGPVYITTSSIERVGDYDKEEAGEICSDCYKKLTKDTVKKEQKCLDT